MSSPIPPYAPDERGTASARRVSKPPAVAEVLDVADFMPGGTSARTETRDDSLNVLFLCHMYPGEAATVIDHCTGFQKYSRHNYFYFCPFLREMPFWMHLDHYDVIVIHYSLYTLLHTYLPASWQLSLAKSNAMKVMFIQDEYRNVDAFAAKMRELGIHILFTCVPVEEANRVYSPENLPGVVKVNNLTGYVPDYLAARRPDFARERPTDVGYRGRELGFWYGELGQEKRWIADGFLARSEGSGLKLDISTREEDRIYGKKWNEFLAACRCTLGTESGASVFDFTGEIEKTVRDYVQRHPQATFREVQAKFLQGHEGKIRLNQISPRAFEAIACGSVLVLFEGDYSGILKPDVHFISLKKDFSNIQEVIAKVKDHAFVRRLAECAYDDVIASGRYSYKAFVEGFDACLDHTIERFLSQGADSPLSPRSQVIRSKGVGQVDEERSGSVADRLVRWIGFFFYGTFFMFRALLKLTRRIVVGVMWRIAKLLRWFLGRARGLIIRTRMKFFIHPIFYSDMPKAMTFEAASRVTRRDPKKEAGT